MKKRFIMTTSGILCVLILAASMSAAGAPMQWPIAVGGNGHWYEAVLVGPSGISWNDARIAAQSTGGYLATIISSQENAFVYSLFKDNDAFWYIDGRDNTCGPWLGGYQAVQPEWIWITGETWAYTNWDEGEPNNELTNNVLRFATAGWIRKSSWNDDTFSYLSPSYIIEWDTMPGTQAFIDITNAPATVAYAVSSCAVAGTSAYCVGTMWVSNAANSQVLTFPAAAGWTAPAVNLAVGANLLWVCGTNVSGQLAGDSVTITRGASDSFPEYTWQRFASPVAARFSGVVVHNGNVYLYGGMIDNNTYYNQCTDAIWKYAADAGTWTKLAGKMPYAMHPGYSPPQVLGDKLIQAPEWGPTISGGWGQHKRVIEFDFSTPNVNAIETATYPVGGNIWTPMIAKTADNRIYSLGGWTGSGYDGVLRYDPVAQTLQTTPAHVSVGQSPYGSVIDPLGYLHVFGIYNNVLNVFDLTPGAETRVATIPNAIPTNIFGIWTMAWYMPSTSRIIVAAPSQSTTMYEYLYATRSFTNTSLAFPALGQGAVERNFGAHDDVSGRLFVTESSAWSGSNYTTWLWVGTPTNWQNGIVTNTPCVDITNAPATVAYAVSSCAVAGTSAYCVGTMWVSNAANAHVRKFPAAQMWVTPPVALMLGANTIMVYGTNSAGVLATDSVTITRRNTKVAIGAYRLFTSRSLAYCDIASTYTVANMPLTNYLDMVYTNYLFSTLHPNYGGAGNDGHIVSEHFPTWPLNTAITQYNARFTAPRFALVPWLNIRPIVGSEGDFDVFNNAYYANLTNDIKRLATVLNGNAAFGGLCLDIEPFPSRHYQGNAALYQRLRGLVADIARECNLGKHASGGELHLYVNQLDSVANCTYDKWSWSTDDLRETAGDDTANCFLWAEPYHLNLTNIRNHLAEGMACMGSGDFFVPIVGVYSGQHYTAEQRIDKLSTVMQNIISKRDTVNRSYGGLALYIDGEANGLCYLSRPATLAAWRTGFVVQNGDFCGGLGPWSAIGRVVAGIWRNISGAFLTGLSAGSRACTASSSSSSIAQSLALPSNAYCFSFDATFLSESGILSVALDAAVLVSVTATPETAWVTTNVCARVPLPKRGTDSTLRFSFIGRSNDTAVIQNIQLHNVEPLPPTRVSASDDETNGTILVTWDRCAASDRYRVYRAQNTNVADAVQLGGDMPDCALLDTTAVADTSYSYWVRAGNDEMWSEYSLSDEGRTIPEPSLWICALALYWLRYTRC